MENQEPVHCPCCSSEEPQEFQYQKWGCRIWRCKACGLGTTDVEDFSPEALYTREYFQGGHVDGYADYDGSEKSLRAEFQKTLEALKLHVSEGGRILELGCAYGYFLLEAQSYFECEGVEISADAVDECRKRGLQVHCGVLDETMLEHLGTYDAVVMFDVIEHLPNPAEVLELIESRLLKSGGILMLTTGDWDSPLARLLGKNWRLMTPPQHLFFFSPRSIGQLLTRLGMDTVEVCHPWKLVPLSLVLYQLFSRLGLKVKLPGWLSKLALPLNLFDAFRLIARKKPLPET